MDYIEKKLKYRKYGNCRVRIYADNSIHLISYQTTVLVAEPERDAGWYTVAYSGTYWDNERVYTPTTARHISEFLREYFPNLTYAQIKLAAEKTGEVYESELAKGVTLYG